MRRNKSGSIIYLRLGYSTDTFANAKQCTSVAIFLLIYFLINKINI
jgi:hypothetical protein